MGQGKSMPRSAVPPEIAAVAFSGRTPSLTAVAEKIKSGDISNIVVLCGAGISVAAGVPDFRTPKIGLYDNLKEYDLPNPTAIFEIDFFKRKPEPFFRLAKHLWPLNLKPTVTHLFLRLLAEKGVLRRVFTQNIDTLERSAGLSEDKVVEVHGSFHTATCLRCRKSVASDYVKDAVFGDRIPRCPVTKGCTGIVKPDIVFFSESLPERFGQLCTEDIPDCDLLLIMGTSLQVHPVAGLADATELTVPRVLFNREEVHHVSKAAAKSPASAAPAKAPDDSDSSSDGEPCADDVSYFRWHCHDNFRDLCLLGDCDDGVLALVELLDWREDLEALCNEFGLDLSAICATRVKHLPNVHHGEPKPASKVEDKEGKPAEKEEARPKDDTQGSL